MVNNDANAIKLARIWEEFNEVDGYQMPRMEGNRYCTGVYGSNVTRNTSSKLLLNFGKIARNTGLVANL
jgi:hypothetical protein